jgi:hypothetical protein
MSAYPTISDNPRTQAFYESMRRKGESHNMAEMLAVREAPGVETDSTFFAGIGTLAKQFEGDEKVLEHVVSRAKALGYNPNPNDFYNGALVDPEIGPGDPAAFVPATGGRGHVRKVCEQRDWSCSGSVNVKRSRREPPKPKVRLADDIVQATVNTMVERNPDLAKVDRRDLAAEVVHQHGGKG